MITETTATVEQIEQARSIASRLSTANLVHWYGIYCEGGEGDSLKATAMRRELEFRGHFGYRAPKSTRSPAKHVYSSAYGHGTHRRGEGFTQYGSHQIWDES